MTDDLIRKPADSDALHPLLAARWSPRAYADRDVPPAALHSVFEAARWAPSTFNNQPWRFIVAQRQHAEAFEQMAACLNESNGRWAPQAPVLMIACARATFSQNDAPNRHHAYDLGLAVGMMAVQAAHLGLVMRQMAGFDPERARQTYAIPDGYAVMTMIALGYQGTLDRLHERYHEREQQPRSRQPQAGFVFSGTWGQAADLSG